ncbi:uncharacterized protein LOC111800878 isoform X2 [Cucurbita pepo subsp. pepo]|uniref:uncharacterized protein LOC111800878 isoform X2 n=1 Tax=Cucurbita pepo subsp. pepo TaxID=3664 RepID=UPI000C9D9492|nr:uncharacterized protein LOC111800878 isoform X2 [Cucurbita pepo subsp. pepo]
MESEAKAIQSLSVGSEVEVGAKGVLGKAYCKCGEGWKCEIKRTQGPDAGKTFVNCGNNCVCIIEGTAEGAVKLQQLAGEGGFEGASCECGEGWSCTISKIEGPQDTKSFAKCAGDCSCITVA